MRGTEPRWDVDIQLDTEECIPYSVDACTSLLMNKLEKAHKLAREEQQVTRC